MFDSYGTACSIAIKLKVHSYQTGFAGKEAEVKDGNWPNGFRCVPG